MNVSSYFIWREHPVLNMMFYTWVPPDLDEGKDQVEGEEDLADESEEIESDSDLTTRTQSTTSTTDDTTIIGVQNTLVASIGLIAIFAGGAGVYVMRRRRASSTVSSSPPSSS